MSIPTAHRKRPSFNPSFSPPPPARRRRAQIYLALACAALVALFLGIPQRIPSSTYHAFSRAPRAEVGEHHRAEGPGEDARQVDDEQALEQAPRERLGHDLESRRLPRGRTRAPVLLCQT